MFNKSPLQLFKRLRTPIALVIVALFAALLANATQAAPAAACTTVCYVDGALGNDANDGDTAATAKKTIQAAVNQVSATGQVRVLTGTYLEDVLVNKAVTITGDGPALTIIDPTTEFKITSGDVTVEDLTVQNGNPHGVRIQNLSVALANIIFDNVHFMTNTARGLEVDATTVTNIQVLNSLFDGNVTGIRMSSMAIVDGFIIDNTTFQNHPNTGSGIGFYQANDGNDGYVKDLHVSNSLFKGSGMSGIYVEEAIDMLIETSEFRSNARGILIFDWYTSPVAVGTLNQITNNEFYHNTAASVQVVAGNENGLGAPVSVDNNSISQDVGALAANWALIDVRLQSTFTHATVDIKDNTITFGATYGAATSAYGIRLRGGGDTVNITGNAINGGSIGTNGGTPPTAGIYVSTNDSFYGAPKATSVYTITKNQIVNFPNGVIVFDPVGVVSGNLPTGATLAITRNNLSGNTSFGISSGPTEDTNGMCNWWGDASGPGPVGPGTGSNVSTDVDFSDWLFTSNLDGTCGQPPITNVCPVDPAVGNVVTDLIGTGQGSKTKGYRTRKLVIPNASNMVDLYGQLAATDIGVMKYVRFLPQGYPKIQISTPTSLAYRAYAISWWGTDLPTDIDWVKGQFFWGAKANKSPRAFVLWPTYDTGATQYANVFETFDTSSENHVAWETGWIPTQTQTLDIPATQLAGATVVVRLAIVDNDKDNRPIFFDVTVGSDTQYNNDTVPNSKDTLNLYEFTFTNVPAGVDEVRIRLTSNGPDEGFPDGGDSAAIIGAAASYECIEPAP